MADGTKSYMWFPVLIALFYTIYTNDVYRDIAHKVFTGDVSGAYEAYSKYSESENVAGVDERVGKSDKKGGNSVIYSEEELAKFSNLKDGLYLAILGRVYDVTEGAKHYAPGGGYHGFIGKDATLAFITGEFNEENLSDDVSTLTNSQAKSIINWVKFYDEKYVYKGKLVGRFYDKNGDPTAEYHEFMDKVERADEADTIQEEMKRKFPPCNVEWKPEDGTRVWCSPQSGGISRDWTGVPRQFFEKPSSAKNRCACVNLENSDFREHQGKFREYENCARLSSTCYVKT
ncbi:neuferricin [Diachasma alloeum]|uniref:neuferricin n=1 Tax=Diachasma alloeum TaxID=454923 RepID=UPI00073817C2|nr:neuferricin [Diachasma alloeum]